MRLHLLQANWREPKRGEEKRRDEKIKIEKSLFSLAFVTHRTHKDHNLDRIKFIPLDLIRSFILSARSPVISTAHVDTLSVLITRDKISARFDAIDGSIVCDIASQVATHCVTRQRVAIWSAIRRRLTASSMSLSSRFLRSFWAKKKTSVLIQDSWIRLDRSVPLELYRHHPRAFDSVRKRTIALHSSSAGIN